MMDHKLSEGAIKLLLLAPLLYLTFGFWMCDNLQIFKNLVYLFNYYKDHYVTGHSIGSLFPLRVEQSTPLLIGLILYTIGLITKRWWLAKGVVDGNPPHEIRIYETLNKS